MPTRCPILSTRRDMIRRRTHSHGLPVVGLHQMRELLWSPSGPLLGAETEQPRTWTGRVPASSVNGGVTRSVRQGDEAERAPRHLRRRAGRQPSWRLPLAGPGAAARYLSSNRLPHAGPGRHAKLWNLDGVTGAGILDSGENATVAMNPTRGASCSTLMSRKLGHAPSPPCAAGLGAVSDLGGSPGPARGKVKWWELLPESVGASGGAARQSVGDSPPSHPLHPPHLIRSKCLAALCRTGTK